MNNLKGFADILISEKDNGIADAWNKGIKLSKNNWILILNSGDILEKDILKKINSLLLNKNLIYTFSSKIVNKNYELIKLNIPNPKMLPYGMYIPHNFTFVPIEHYKKNGLYKNLPLSMDYEWFLRNYKFIRKKFSSNPDLIVGSFPLGGKSDVNAFLGFIFNLKFQLNYLSAIYIPFLLFNFILLNVKQLIFNLKRIYKNEK